jgi:hypothetical protein
MGMAKKQENLKKDSAPDLSIVDKSGNKPAHNTKKERLHNKED